MDPNNTPSEPESKTAIRRRIRLWWIGLVGYLFIFGNAMRFAFGAPYQVFLIGQIINFTIIVGMAMQIRKEYRNLRNGPTSDA